MPTREKLFLNDEEKLIKEVISKGLQDPEDIAKNKKQWIFVTVRIKNETVDLIDNIIAEERVGLSRNAWILEAIYEKLKRTE